MTEEGIVRLAERVRAEFIEMPGLRLTIRQAARLFHLPVNVAHATLDALRTSAVLTSGKDGSYRLTESVAAAPAQGRCR